MLCRAGNGIMLMPSSNGSGNSRRTGSSAFRPSASEPLQHEIRAQMRLP